MARSVSAEFKKTWKRKQGTRDRVRVRYKRRYWNGSAFANEASFQTLDEDDFLRVGEIPMQLDSPLQNIFRTSMVTLRLDNTRNQWVQADSPPSVFAADNVATSGYRLHRTIFQIQTGYVLSDGTTEWVTRFTGLAVRARLTSGGAEAEVLVASYALKLEKSDAERVSDTFTLEDCVPATGDGSNKAFESASTGVDHLTDVQVNASALTVSQFSVSNLNEIAVPGNTGRAAITLQTAPLAGQTVKCSGVKWKQNQAFQTLLGLIADEAGIASSERSIQAVVFSGGVAGSKTVDSQAQWQAATLTNADAERVPGTIERKWYTVDDFTDGDFTANPAWERTLNDGSNNVSIVGAGNQLRVLAQAQFPGGSPFSNAAVQTPFEFSTGTVSMDVDAGNTGTSSLWSAVYGGMVVMMQATLFVNDPSIPASSIKGYGLHFSPRNGTIYLFRWDGTVLNQQYLASDGSTGARLADLGTSPASHHVWKMSRNGDGRLRVYRDSTLVAEVYDTTYSSFVAIGIASQVLNGGGGVLMGMTLDCDDVLYSRSAEVAGETPSKAAAVWESNEFDLLSPPTQWGVLEHVETLNGGTITISTAVASSSGGPYDAYVALGAGGLIGSALKRFLKIKVEIGIGSGLFVSPSVDRLVANFLTTDVFVSLAILRGLTGLDAFERYARFADYETGFDGDGNLFFRSKAPAGDAVVDLNQENGVIEVTDYDGGEDLVANVGRVRHGERVAVYDKSNSGEAAPTSEAEFGRVVLEADLSEILVANDLKIADGRAQLFYERGYRKKRRLRAVIWDVPWLELSDLVKVSIYDHPLLRETIAGDPLQDVSSGFMAAGEAANILARNLKMKVLELKPNLDTNRAEVYLEEVLA